MTEDNDDLPSPNEQWAIIFNRLGKERLRQFLFHATAKLEGENQEKVVYEIQNTDSGVAVLDITGHVDELESHNEEPNLPGNIDL